MSLSVLVNRVAYSGNGEATRFTYPFKVFDEADLKVIKWDGSQETVLTLGSDYEISGVGEENGGYIDLASPLESGHRLVLVRDVPLTQEVNLYEGRAFRAEAVEKALDRMTMQIQRMEERLSRAFALRETTAVSSFPPFPEPPSTDARYIRWKQDGTGLECIQLLGDEVDLSSLVGATEWALADYDVSDHGDPDQVGSIAYLVNQAGGDKIGILLRGSHTYSFRTDYNIPGSVTLVFQPGAKLYADNAIVVFYTNQIFAGPEQIFLWAGNGKFLLYAAESTVYPEWWGANGDGLADCTGAFQTMLASLWSLRPVTVRLTGWRYKITSEVSSSDRYLNILGNGLTTIYLPAPANPSTNAFPAFTFTNVKGRFANFNFLGEKEGYTPGYTYTQYGRALKLVNCYDLNIEDVIIEEMPGFGFELQGCDRVRVRDCYFKNIGHPRSQDTIDAEIRP